MREYIGPEERGVRKALGSLICTVRAFESQIDAEMAEPGYIDRGNRIARLVNALTLENDRALYHGLGFDFRKDTPTKKPNIKAIMKLASRSTR